MHHQSCAVRDAREDLSSLGVDVVGISPDVPEDQMKFDQKFGLGFPLLADTDHSVAEAYDVWGEKMNYGKKYMGIIRSSFLIGEDGRIEHAWYKVSPKDTVPNAERPRRIAMPTRPIRAARDEERREESPATDRGAARARATSAGC